MTTPLRIVFNASSQASPDQPSLNSCLLTGPSLTSTLFDYLVGFRMHPFAVIADISKAFLRIMINEDHRNFTKIFWFKDDSLTDICVFRFRVVMSGATSSPFLLQRTISYHLENHPEPLANNLLHHFYVDNFAKCYDSRKFSAGISRNKSHSFGSKYAIAGMDKQCARVQWEYRI